MSKTITDFSVFSYILVGLRDSSAWVRRKNKSKNRTERSWFLFCCLFSWNCVTPLPGFYEKYVPKQDGALANFVWLFFLIFCVTPLPDFYEKISPTTGRSALDFLFSVYFLGIVWHLCLDSRKNKSKNRAERSRFFSVLFVIFCYFCVFV